MDLNWSIFLIFGMPTVIVSYIGKRLVIGTHLMYGKKTLIPLGGSKPSMSFVLILDGSDFSNSREYFKVSSIYLSPFFLNSFEIYQLSNLIKKLKLWVDSFV